MEKKEEITLIDAFKDFKEEKNIDRPVMMGVLKDVFLTQIAKTYGSADNFDVIINVDKGDCEIYQNFDVVEEVENPNTQITLDQIKKETGDDDYEIGDVYTKKLSLASFGRRGILNIRPTYSRPIPTRSERSSPARSTRHGQRRSSSSTTTTTSCTFLRPSRFLARDSRRATPSAPSSRAWR